MSDTLSTLNPADSSPAADTTTAAPEYPAHGSFDPFRSGAEALGEGQPSGDGAASRSTDTAGDNAETEGQQTTDPAQDVPFHEHPRWKEVMAERDALRQQVEAVKAADPVLSQIRQEAAALGVTVESWADVPKAQAALAQQQAWQQEQYRLAQYAQELNGRLESGEITQEVAEQLYQAKQVQAQVQQTQQVIQGQMREQALTAARASIQEVAPVTPEVEKILASFGPQAIPQVAADLKNILKASNDAAIARYNQDRARAQAQKAPEGRGGSPAPAPGAEYQRGSGFSRLFSPLGR